MFTGIITGVGRIASTTPLTEGPGTTADHGLRLRVKAPSGYLDDVALGDSIAINGACMTVVAFDAPAAHFDVDVSAESLDKTTGLTQPGPVNLEKALRAHDRLGGHIVSGHVDGTGRIGHFAPVGESWELRVVAPAALAGYIAVKGSVAVHGVSLTVNTVTDLPRANGANGDAEGCEFSINLIPHTLAHTTFGTLKAGDRVNLEIDTIARYVERMTHWQRHAG